MRVMNWIVVVGVAAFFSTVSVGQTTQDSLDCIDSCYEVEDLCMGECTSTSTDEAEQCAATCTAESDKCQKACSEED
jgi:hypothetical protein